MDGCGDGSWKGEQYFSCRDGHAVFIVLSKLKPDSRFVQQPQGDNRKCVCACVCINCLHFFRAGLWYMLPRDWKECCSQADMQYWNYNGIPML